MVSSEDLLNDPDEESWTNSSTDDLVAVISPSLFQ